MSCVIFLLLDIPNMKFFDLIRVQYLKNKFIFHIFSTAYISIQIKHTVLLKLTMWRKSMYMYMYWYDSWHISVEEFMFISFYLKNYLKYFILIKIISSWDQFCWDINFLSRGYFLSLLIKWQVHKVQPVIPRIVLIRQKTTADGSCFGYLLLLVITRDTLRSIS